MLLYGFTMKVCAILLAAGASSRMGFNKILIDFNGRTPIELCCEAFREFADEIVIAVSENTLEAAKRCREHMPNQAIKLVFGGLSRQESVYNALMATEAEFVAVHDCARCLIDGATIAASIASAMEHGCGIASLALRDTIRSTISGEVLPREELLCAQTPQCFLRKELIEAYAIAAQNDKVYTDDAAIFHAAGHKLYYSPGSLLNQKLTVPEDLDFFRSAIEKRISAMIRIGYGEDTHRLVAERRLVLGGVDIPFELGLLGHSDADALCHAVADALLGACALGDIGMHFPDSDARYKDVLSLKLLSACRELVHTKGYSIINVDACIIAQRPKLAAFREQMQKNLAEALRLSKDCISIKFTTPEGLGPEGRLEGITVRAVAAVVG